MRAAEKAFLAYTEPYLAYGEKIRLKIDHTLRVRDLCEEIAESLGLDAQDRELASFCGLMHDIGRFEQWKRYGTYMDARSVDHGDLGADLLEAGEVSCFSCDEPETVIKTVRYHNKFELPQTLSERERLFAGIVRDADKLDILYLSASGELTVRTHGSAISQDVMGSLKEHRPIRKEEVRTKADSIAVRLAFPFGMNTGKALEILREKGYLHGMISVQLEEAESGELKDQLRELDGLLLQYPEDRTG